VELVMASVILGLTLAFVARVSGWVVSERRSADRRQVAAIAAANLMERLTALPYESLSDSSAKAERDRLAPALASLPGGEATIEVATDDPTGGPGSKRIAVRIRWRDRADRWEAPVRLTSWVYPTRSETPDASTPGRPRS
jgi:hypothetical protein